MFEYSDTLRASREWVIEERHKRLEQSTGHLFTRPHFERLSSFDHWNAAALIFIRTLATISSKGVGKRARDEAPAKNECVSLTLADDRAIGVNNNILVGYYPRQILNTETDNYSPQTLGIDPSIPVWASEADPVTGVNAPPCLVGWVGFRDISEAELRTIDTELQDEEIFGQPYINLYNNCYVTEVSIDDRSANDIKNAINEAANSRIEEETRLFAPLGETAILCSIA